jgi:hypothetical protein
MKKLIEKIEEKIGCDQLADRISENISNSDLNSLLLEIFKNKTEKISPANLLNQFSNNRFTLPSTIDVIEYKKFEIKWLESAKTIGFTPIQLSPLTQLGSSSAVGFVNQNNVVSALRNTEVVSDSTNVLALIAANEFKKNQSNYRIRYSTTHRHTRAQHFTNPAFSAHFGAFCMVSGGIDTGSFSFELEELHKHLAFYLNILENELENRLIAKIYLKSERKDFIDKLIESVSNISSKVNFTTEEVDNTVNYYNLVRIKIFAIYKEHEIDLIDMGFVDWTKKMLNNKKHRMLTSGGGLELIFKIKNKLI